MSQESQKFQELLTQVDTIIKEISDPQLDLDQLTLKVELGFSVVQNMKTKLDQTKMKIETIRSSFQEKV